MGRLDGLILLQSTEESDLMRRFYISGPMRGLPQYNFPAFDAAAKEGRARGYGIMSPADMDRELGHTENDSLEEINTPENQRRFASRDCAAILALKAENGDGIALLPGWEKSTGAIAELFLARWVKLCVVNAVTWQPFTRLEMSRLCLTAVIHSLRKFIGDDHADEYYEMGPVSHHD